MAAWRVEANVEPIAEHVKGKPLKQSSFPHYEQVRECGDNGPCYHASFTNDGNNIVHLEVVAKGMLLCKVPA